MNEHGDVILGVCVVVILAALIAIAIVRLCQIEEILDALEEEAPKAKPKPSPSNKKRETVWLPVPLVLFHPVF
jgi:hypothetical protein